MKQTKFGMGQVSNTTPKWAIQVMNIIIAMAVAANAWVASTNRIIDADKVEYMLWISIVTSFLHYVSKMFGIEVQEPNWKKK